MKIDALKLEVTTTDGDYGFFCEFSEGLNIVRGNNSSGKSTLLNSMIYALGMEEILGGKGEKVLPYSLKDYLPVEEDKHPIVNSLVRLQIQNDKGRVITLNRPIKSDEKSSKLIEIIEGPYLTGTVENVSPKPTFVHDPGAAKSEQAGFYRILEGFLGMKLPAVPGTTAKEVTLYLQTLFSAFIIEQKRGWTDYLANIPFYGIRNTRNKVVEYLLNLDVFENERERNNLNYEAVEINQKWEAERYKVKLVEDNNNLSIEGIPIKPVVDFSSSLLSVNKLYGDDQLSLENYIGTLVGKIEAIERKQKGDYSAAPEEMVKRMEEAVDEVSRLNSLHESIVSEVHLNKSLLKEYASTKESLTKDLSENKVARKLRELGAEYSLKVANDHCPTCLQHVDDSLLLADTNIQPMNINENITYLEKQVKMLERYMSGIDNLISKQNRQLSQIQDELKDKKSEVLGIRRDMSSVSELSEADLRNQLRYEDEIEQLEKADSEITNLTGELTLISKRFKKNKKNRAALPKSYLSKNDNSKLKFMESVFKKMAGDFGYQSADTREIEINYDTYSPFLSGIALREISNSNENEESKSDTDANIKADSSASDFVRLIWAYLLAMYQTSAEKKGNHPGLIAFDEPGQHSMRDSSVNALFKSLNDYSGLQSIVAASFDENDSVFDKETEGVTYNLIEVGEKLIKQL
ncbi:MAG: AAA family ATPase [Candidatus Thiodiazotropha lotti]|nr:AAA family ATPase [Candidatus Thiodiazotropha lotti]